MQKQMTFTPIFDDKGTPSHWQLHYIQQVATNTLPLGHNVPLRDGESHSSRREMVATLHIAPRH